MPEPIPCDLTVELLQSTFSTLTALLEQAAAQAQEALRRRDQASATVAELESQLTAERLRAAELTRQLEQFASPPDRVMSAPALVCVSHVDPNDPALRSCWDFGDSSGRGLPLAWTAAHLYERPGDYLLVRETGQARMSERIRVLPDSRRQIFVSARGDDSNDGAEPRPVRSWQVALARTGAGEARIRLCRGETFDFDRMTDCECRDLVVDGETFGEPARPAATLRYTGPAGMVSAVRFNRRCDGIIVIGVQFSALLPHPYGEPGKELNNGSNKGIHAVTFGGATRCALVRCVFDNLDSAVGGAAGLLVQDCTDASRPCWRGLVAGEPTIDWIFVGCRFGPAAPGAQLIRFVPQKAVIACCDLSNPGNAVIRFDTGVRGVVHGNTIRGGAVKIGPLSIDDPSNPAKRAEFSGFHHFERNLLLRSQFQSHPASRDVSYLDNVIIAAPGEKGFVLNPSNNTFGFCSQRVVIEHNTVVQSGASGMFMEAGTGVPQTVAAPVYVLGGNLFAAPNLRWIDGHNGTGWALSPASIAESAGNVWAICGNMGPGGPCWRAGQNTMQWWNSLPMVQGRDLALAQVRVDDNYRPSDPAIVAGARIE